MVVGKRRVPATEALLAQLQLLTDKLPTGDALTDSLSVSPVVRGQDDPERSSGDPQGLGRRSACLLT
jgi:hypothetical protein